MNFRFVALFMFVVSACATPKTYLRVATATEADFERVSKLDAVWYEFQPGDTVPFNLLYFGAIEGGAAGFGVKAKSPFYLVAYKNRPIMVSYDGERVSPHSIRSIIAVLPNSEGRGGAVNWVTYLGEARDPEQELQKLLETK